LIKAPYVISWFIKIYSKRIYCCYSRIQKIQNGFLSIIFVIIFEVNIVPEQKQANLVNIFYSFPLPSAFLTLPYTTAPASLTECVETTVI